MFKLKRHAKIGGGIPTASLADIVFLLMIFFLLTTSMNPAKGLGLTLPPPGEIVEVQQKNVLNVFVNPKGDVLVAGEITPLNMVKQRIQEKREEFKKQPGKETEEIIVSLLAHPDADYKFMIDVLDEIKLAGATKISLATPQF